MEYYNREQTQYTYMRNQRFLKLHVEWNQLDHRKEYIIYNFTYLKTKIMQNQSKLLEGTNVGYKAVFRDINNVLFLELRAG